MIILFHLCYITLIRENYALKDTVNKKNMQFVENLKQDLRRNNDDYIDSRRSVSQINSTQKSDDHVNFNDIRYKLITTRNDKKITKSNQVTNIENSVSKVTQSHNALNNNVTEDVRIKIIDNIRRRVNDALVSKEVIKDDQIDPQRRAALVNPHKTLYNNEAIEKNNGPRVRPIWSDMRNFLPKHSDKLNQYRMRLLSNKRNTNSPSQFTPKIGQTTDLKENKVKRKKVRKSKMEKFKKFIQKNKGLLREFISNKKQVASMRPATPHRPHPVAQKHNKMFIGRETNKIIRLSGDELKKNLEELPNPAMLDMFPAKGGRIHSKRVRGHLCHRHVLIPEGPKYNSLGHIYLPPHAVAGIAHEYNATEVPKLLLPKCCNCCRKSVLGCE